MTFVDLNLNNTYDSDEDNILEDFYIPVLSKSVRYNRLAGYFSSTTLAAAAQGMADFIKNCGKMKLVTSIRLSEQDQQAMLDGVHKPEEIIVDNFWREFNIVDNIQGDRVAALAWMISQGNLEIKIAIPSDKRLLSTNTHDSTPLYHQKIGILYDAMNNRITFSGSVNETGMAWNSNIEEFKVFCSWKRGQEAYGDSDAEKFDKFWSNKSINTNVYDLPSAIKKYLIGLAPRSKGEAVEKISSMPTLHSYQHEAVDKWSENNYCGVLEMATGTGKTRVAIACINKILKADRNARYLVVIACPSTHLIHQWAKDLEMWRYRPQLAYSGVQWQHDIKNKIYQLNYGIIKNLIIVVTHKTFASKLFIEIVSTCQVESMVVVDEVHGIGAQKTKQGLLGSYRYKLGLSATPERYFDEHGTTALFSYFGNVVFKFDLDNAIQQGYLVPYKFFPRVAYLTDDEMAIYFKFSRQIAIEYNKPDPDQKKIEKLQFRRANVVKNASRKMDVLANILGEINELDHCLIYCADTNQVKNAFPILNEKDVLFHQFTQAESDNVRINLLDDFDKGIKPVLLAIRCLDEGVDVPSTRTAIILASSGNPREFVQRRGRVLRLYNGKNYANVYDVIALPEFIPDDIYTESQKTMITKELNRLNEFASSSMNPQETNQLVLNLKTRYKVR